MNYNELCEYCKAYIGAHDYAESNTFNHKLSIIWVKFCKGTTKIKLDEAADAVAQELKIGRYSLYLPEPAEYEEILASQELMK